MKLARDVWLTFQYEVGLLIHNPVNVAITLIQPITYLAFFTPFLKAVMGVSTYGGAYQVYVPSLFVAMGLFSGMYAGFALLAAMRKGVITRFRVAPLSRVGLLLGRELMYVLLIGFQALVITVFALVFGLRVALPNFLLALMLLSMMVLLGVSVSYALALFVTNETVLVNLVNGVAQPLSLLAGVLIPLSVAPLWVRQIAVWNPFAWGANAIRTVFHGQVGAQVVWQGTLILAVLAALAVTLSSRLFSREIG
jgi:ABC-2 type transport system permease protein